MCKGKPFNWRDGQELHPDVVAELQSQEMLENSMARTANMDFNRAALLKFETESIKPPKGVFDLNDSVMSP